jgi:hypothetical protein
MQILKIFFISLLIILTGCISEQKNEISYNSLEDNNDFSLICLNSVTYIHKSRSELSYKGYMNVKFNTQSKVIPCTKSPNQKISESDFYILCIENVSYYIMSHSIKSLQGKMAVKFNPDSTVNTCDLK